MKKKKITLLIVVLFASISFADARKFWGYDMNDCEWVQTKDDPNTLEQMCARYVCGIYFGFQPTGNTMPDY